ncbi:MAG: hypothetical protein FWD25_07480 [Clostridia bacterium]|nr:hypothetical protein [Clostridia bacterium]
MRKIVAMLLLVCLLCEACLAYAEVLTDENDYIIDQTAEALGMALTLETLYYDGVTFHLDYRAENLRPETPALVLYTKVMVDGERVATTGHPAAHWYPHVFALFMGDEKIYNLSWASFIAQVNEYAWQGEVEVTASFVVKRPTKPMVVVDDEVTENDRQAMLEAMRAHGVTIAGLDEMDADVWREKGYLVVNRYGWNTPDGEFVVTDLSDVETEEVEITFRVDLDALL